MPTKIQRPEKSYHKKARILKMSDKTYKLLCLADKENYDPIIGLENLVQMYQALGHQEEIQKRELKWAQKKAKSYNL